MGDKISILPVVGLIGVDAPVLNVHFFIENDGKDRIASLIYWNGLNGFEKGEMSVFCNLMAFCNIFIDVGANTGVYSLIAGAANKQVYAFEPVPDIFVQLKRNIALNKFDNIDAIRSAVTSYDGTIDLYVPYSPGFPTSSSTLFGFRPPINKLVVKAETLDRFVNDHKLPNVDLIKIDTEATEDKVLQGGIFTITNYRPVILCEVLKNTTEIALNHFFEGMNYKFYQITQEGLLWKDVIEGSNDNSNYLFVPGERKDILGSYLESLVIR